MNQTTLPTFFKKLATLLLLPLCTSVAANGEEPTRLDVHEMSVWVTEPNRNQFNTGDLYLSAMPGIVDSSRSRRADAGKSEVTPLSLLTFSGKPPETTDVTLKIGSGRFIAHWPAAEIKNNRLRWLDLKLSAEPTSDAFGIVPEPHWFHTARKLPGLYLRRGDRPERFLCYDAELQGELTVRVEAGGDGYKIVNGGTFPINDVLLIAPTPTGRRFGWLKEIAAAVAPPAKGKDEKKPATPPAAGEKAEKPEAAAPTGTVVVAAAPAAAPAPVAPQITAGSPDILPVTPNAGDKPVPTPSPAPAATKETTAEIELSPPLDEKQLAEQAGGALRTALTAAGLTESEINLLMEMYAKPLLGSDEMVLLFRLPQSKIDEMLPLEVDPDTAKIVRVGLIFCHKIDPKIHDEIKELTAQLSDAKYAKREAAEERLKTLGRIALPQLKALLKSEDPEAAMRAERLLLLLNESLDSK